jgi:hypothetical protein
MREEVDGAEPLLGNEGWVTGKPNHGTWGVSFLTRGHSMAGLRINSPETSVGQLKGNLPAKEILSLCLIGIAIFSSTSHAHEPYFDLSNPKILLGLLIGGLIPYFAPAIPAAVTKWLIFALLLTRTVRPTAARLCAVAVCEPLCALAAMECVNWLAMPRYVGLILYLLFATAPNLLLFPLRNQDSQSHHQFLKRGLSAFSTGIVYLGYCLVLVLLWRWWIISLARLD